MRYIKVKFSDGKTRRVPFMDPMRPVDIKELSKLDSYTGWIAEEKIDGSLTLMYIVDGAVAYLNRRGINKTPVYPELIVGIPKKKGMTILEGEIYARSGGTDSFEAFLKRDLLQSPEKAKERMREIPLKFRAFDILMENGKWVTNKPILERKAILKEVIPTRTRIEVSPYHRDIEEFTKEMRKDPTVEGVVYKKIPNGFEEGRSGKWKKLKFKKIADTVIIGYEKGKGRRKDIGALKVGVYDKGKIKEVADVGTGFTDEELEDIKKRLDKGERLFAKVEYMKVGSRGRLRAPVFSGLREDITVKETHL